MASLARYNFRVIDARGNVVIGDWVTVNRQATGTPATIYADEAYTAKANPIQTDAEGQAWFYAYAEDFQLVSASYGTVVDLTAYEGASREILVRKTDPAHEVVNNSIATQDDDDLYFAVGANENWHFRFVCKYTTAAAAGIRVNVTSTGGLTWGRVFIRVYDGTTLNWTTLRNFNTTMVLVMAAADGRLIIDAGCRTSAISTIKLRWAQGALDATDTTMYQHSWAVGRKTAI